MSLFRSQRDVTDCGLSASGNGTQYLPFKFDLTCLRRVSFVLRGDVSGVLLSVSGISFVVSGLSCGVGTGSICLGIGPCILVLGFL